MQPSKEEISLTMSKAIQRMVKKYQDGEFERGMSRAKLELSQKDKRIEELTGFCQELEKRLKASEEQEKLFIGSREEHSDIAISINSGQATIEKSRYGTQGEATAGFVFDLLAKHLQNFLESAISKVFAYADASVLEIAGKTAYEQQHVALGINLRKIAPWDQLSREYQTSWVAAAEKSFNAIRGLIIPEDV